MTPILIDTIPDDAVFTNPSRFCELEDCIDHFQMLDPRLDLDSVSAPAHFTRMFETKDEQLSKQACDVICGVSLFRQEYENYHQPFSDYMAGLDAMVNFFRAERPGYKLRVYVGDNVWDYLYSEGCLKLKDVDFIRMKDSSSWSIVGQWWRCLVFGDQTTKYARISDIDFDPDLFPMIFRDVKQVDLLYTDTSYDLYYMPRLNVWRLIGDPFFVRPHGKYPYIRNIAGLGLYDVNSLVRGSRLLPVSDLAPFFGYCLGLRSDQMLYHPYYNMYSVFREVPLMSIEFMELWPFLLTKHLRMRFQLGPVQKHGRINLLDWFLEHQLAQRFYRQLSLEGHGVCHLISDTTLPPVYLSDGSLNRDTWVSKRLRECHPGIDFRVL